MLNACSVWIDVCCNKMRPLVLFLVFVVLIVNSVVVAYSNEFTITIEPGKEDCFYTPVPKNVYLEVDYQVRYMSTGFRC